MKIDISISWSVILAQLSLQMVCRCRRNEPPADLKKPRAKHRIFHLNTHETTIQAENYISILCPKKHQKETFHHALMFLDTFFDTH